ncbi:hypothetical protein MMC22_011960, partial [Lobaria immixta]|nr:hypothetical protein [Lobaria immixta]
MFTKPRANYGPSPTTRQKLQEEAGTNRYQEILSTGKGLRAVARWVMNEGLLAQLSLAKEQIDLVEGRTSHDGGLK